MKPSKFALAWLLTAVLAGGAAAQGGDTFIEVNTYYSGGALSFPAGVRSIAMGTSGTASLDRLATGRRNPAALAWAEAVTAQGSQFDWLLNSELRDITVSGGVVPAGKLQGWRFGGAFSYTQMDMNDIELRTIFLPEGAGTTLDLSSYVLTAAGAAGWESDRVIAGGGVALKYLSDNLGGDDATAWAVDLGLVVGFPLDVADYFVRPRAGATITNLSSGIEFGDTEADMIGETRLALGIDAGAPMTTIGAGAWARTVPVVVAAVDVDRATDRNSAETHRTWGIGFELSLIDMVHARVGSAERLFGFAVDATTYGVGLGWEVGTFFARFDYARISDFEGGEFFTDESDKDVFGLAVGGRL